MQVKIQMSPYKVLQDIVDAAVLNGPEGPFSETELAASIVLSAYGDSNQSRNSAFAAYAISRMDEEDRKSLVSRFELPSVVLSAIMEEVLPDWPFAAVPEEPIEGEAEEH